MGRTSGGGSSRSPPASGRSSWCLGEGVTDRNGSSANVMTNSYNGTSTDNWAIDDHNGHFVIRNKSTNAYLRSNDSNGASPISVTTSYSGAADTDWDLFAVDSL
jgi:hypothetical protein